MSARNLVQALKEDLRRKIEGCDSLGGMEKEKWAFQQSLKLVDRYADFAEQGEEVAGEALTAYRNATDRQFNAILEMSEVLTWLMKSGRLSEYDTKLIEDTLEKHRRKD